MFFHQNFTPKSIFLLPKFKNFVLGLGGEVFNHLFQHRRFSELDAAGMIRQMLEAIRYIHDLDIMHRDIKAENFLLAEDDFKSCIKMIDFGFATKHHADDPHLEELCG